MKRGLKILITASLVNSFGVGLFGPIYAIFVEQIGGDILTAGAAWAVYCIAIGLATFVFSRFEDHIPKEKGIVLGYALLTIGMLSYYFIDNALQLFIVQFYMGLALAFINPVWDAYFTIKADKGKEAAEWGVWEGGMSIATGIAALVGALIAQSFGFKTLFLVMFSISAVSTAIAYLLLKKKK